MLKDLVKNIYKHAENESPNECCGLIIEKNKKMKYIKMKNLSNNKKDHFKMDDKLFTFFQFTEKILYVVHSHYNSNCNPSEHDINTCNALQIPYLIVSYPNKDYKVVQPC